MATLIRNEKQEMINIGHRIKEVKKAKRISLRELEKKTGISKNILERIMAGTRDPEETDLAVLAETFDISMDRLLTTDVAPIIEKLESCLRQKNVAEDDLTIAYH